MAELMSREKNSRERKHSFQVVRQFCGERSSQDMVMNLIRAHKNT